VEAACEWLIIYFFPFLFSLFSFSLLYLISGGVTPVDEFSREERLRRETM